MEIKTPHLDEEIQEELNGLNIWSYLRRCLRFWYVFILLAILSIGAAWVKLQSLPLVYSISGKVYIDQNESANSMGGQNLISPLSSRAGGSLYDEVEIIKSRQLMSEVVQKLHLDKTYYIDTRFGLKEVFQPLPFEVLTGGDKTQLYGRSFQINPISPKQFELIINEVEIIEGRFDQPLDFMGASLLISNNQINLTPLFVSFAWPHDAARAYSGKLSVQQVGRSNVLELSMEDASSHRAVNVLNEIVIAYNAYVLNKNKRSARTMIEFIDDRLTIISDELFAVEKKVEDYKKDIEVPIDITSSANSFLNQVNVADGLILELGLQRDFLEDIKSRLENDFDGLDYLPINLDIDEGSVNNNLISVFNDLLSRRKRLLISATEQNPSVRNVSDELINTRENILKWIEIKDEQLSKQQEFYEDQLEPVERQIAEVPRYQRELLQIIRQQKIKETLFNYLLQRREETAITLASEVTSTTTLDSPLVGPLVSPNKIRIYIIYLIIGLAIPACVFLLIELLDRTIHNESELKGFTKSPFLGSISKTRLKNRLIGRDEGKSVISEMVRLIRTNLNFLLQSPNEPNVVLVTSSQSGEGKTFVSINLAAIIAQSGKTVVALELDLRKPKLREYLDITDKSLPGISNFLSGSHSDISSLAKRVQGHKDFHFIPSGPIPPNPAELIMGERMNEMITQLKVNYDFVIIDSPPIGVVADAFLFKDYVDASIYVVRASHTRKENINILNDARKDKLTNVGVILNGIKIGRGYGNYRRYGYGYYGEKRTKGINRITGFFKK